jgi:hypothetical protein
MADRQYSTLIKLGFGTLTFNSVLAVYKSWGNAGSIAFVLATNAALALLFLCLCELEQQQAVRGCGRNVEYVVKAAVWVLLTLLMAMFAARVAPLMPVENMASYAISSSMILVIHDNMINGTNHIV